VPVARVPVARVPVARVPVLRLVVLRLVVRPAEPFVLRAEARPPRAPSVFAAAFTRVPVERVPVLRRVVPPPLLEAVLRDAVVRRVPVEREPVLRLLVLRPVVDRRVVPPDDRLVVAVDLLRAVAICSS
jgi:hypothetical protein